MSVSHYFSLGQDLIGPRVEGLVVGAGEKSGTTSSALFDLNPESAFTARGGRGAPWCALARLPGEPPARRSHGGPGSVLRGVGPPDAVRRFGVDHSRGGGPRGVVRPRGVDPRGVVRHGIQTFEVWW